MTLSESEIKKLNTFSEQIGVVYNDIQNLRTALTHRSYINENIGSGIHHNERFEFLGDAVLELIITEYLFGKYSDRPEGELTSFRAATVKTESLAETAEKLNFGKFLYMSKGEELTGGREKPYILANTYESILGSIYIDKDFEAAKKFVHANLIPKIDNIVKHRLDIDCKSKLQEMSQDILSSTPRYKLLDAVGPDHSKIFTMQVLIGEKPYGIGKGRSKQDAEQNAAEAALKNWNKLNI